MNNITEIAEKVAEIVKSQLEGEVNLTKIEQTTREVMQEIGRAAVTKSVEAMSQRYPERMIACPCGGEASYVRRREACLHTLCGKVVVKRAYYLCPQCHKGRCPLDEKLGLRPNKLSAELSRLVAMTGVQLPFEKGRDLFEALTLVSVSDQGMAKATRQVGQRVAEAEDAWQEMGRDEAFLWRQEREARRPLRLYGSIDAAKVHIREEEGHHWRDLKIGAWFEAVGQPPQSQDGQWSIQAKHISYYAHMAPANEFGDLVWSSGVAHDAQLAQELIILGDGADWIWNIVDEHFPQAIQILDWFHASQHLILLAQTAFALQSEQADWIARMKQLMWQGHIETLVTACRELSQTCSSDLVRTTANYFESHKERMRYAYFRQQGYQIGSGTIESAAKQIGLMRMKVPGASWNREHACLVAKARAAYLSDRWDSLPLAW